MSHSTVVVLLVALFAVSTYGIQNRPLQLKFTSTWQERLDRYIGDWSNDKLKLSYFIPIYPWKMLFGVHFILKNLSDIIVILKKSAFSIYSALKTCNEHVIRTDTYFSDYISLNNEGSFRFFTIAQAQIDFQLSLVPYKTTLDLYTGEYLRFSKDHFHAIFHSTPRLPIFNNLFFVLNFPAIIINSHQG